jgi:cell division protein FtsI (penicillin-binding protein 3)
MSNREHPAAAAPDDRRAGARRDEPRGGSAPNGRAGGERGRPLEVARNRLLATGLIFAIAFLIVAGQLVHLAVAGGGGPRRAIAAMAAPAIGRGDITDRNGHVLAKSIPLVSLHANAQDIGDPEAAVRALATVFPDLDRPATLARLSSGKRFVWVRRNVTPDEQFAVLRLGLPGLSFENAYSRVYTNGRSAAHLLGLTNIDEFGIAGVEKAYDPLLANGEDVRLSLDNRLQHIVRSELVGAIREFRAIGAAGLVLDVRTGELLASVSLPDFDPNNPMAAPEEARFNRVTKGVYEMGSVFKVFTTAMALDSGVATLTSGYDASRPLRRGRFTISDYHAANRWLSVPEILVHSSNIGSALMALDVGGARQQEYLKRFGLLTPAAFDLPEVGEPLAPKVWRDIHTMTVGFGHGVAVTPLQLATAVAAVVNGGILRPATLLRRDGAAPVGGIRVLSERTSRQMRGLMRLVVQYGTGTRAEVAGYHIGGKTGTAEKLVSGRYRTDKRVSSFIGAFPMEAPRYVVFAMVDEPRGTVRSANYATGGWVAAPAVGRIVERMGALFGIAPAADQPERPIEAKMTRKERLALAIRDVIANDWDKRFAAN